MDINYISIGDQNFSELDIQYMPSLWSRGEFSIKRRMSVLHRYGQISLECSDSARRHVQCQLRVSYGKSEKQKFDLYGVDSLPEKAPLLIFVHGGYWVQGSREMSAWFVESFHDAGICVAVVGYDLAPEVSLDDMVRQIKTAIRTIRDFVKPRRKIYVSGHSAGAQLIAAALLLDDFSDQKDVVVTVEGLILVSGLFNLEPLANTSFVPSDTKFDRATLIKNSPAIMSPEILGYRCHERSPRGIFLACGEWEPPKFKEETWNFTKLLEEGNVPVYHTVLPKSDHFSIVADLRLKEYKLTQEVISFVKTGSLPRLP